MPARARAARRAAPRRKFLWVRKYLANIGGASVQEDVFSGYRSDYGTLLNNPGLTIMRTLVKWGVTSASGVVGDTFVHAGLRIGNIGDTQVLSPSTDEYTDWFWVDTQFLVNGGTRSLASNLVNESDSRWYDVKSRRKLDSPTRTPYFHASTPGGDAETHVAIQMLVMLP